MLLRSELLHGRIEDKMNLTILTRRGEVDWKGPGSPGKARWRDRGFGRGGRVGERSKKGESKKKIGRDGR